MQEQGLKKLVDCFGYLKRYYTDIFDALHAMLELLLLQKKYQIFDGVPKESLIRQKIKDLALQDSLILQANFKLCRLEKYFADMVVDLEIVEEFFFIITQQKTSNKLYYYSTPLQVNRLLIGLLQIEEDDKIYNPCYGMGSIFLSLVQMQKNIELYGEELDPRLSQIAFLILQICEIPTHGLYVNDLLKSPRFVDGDQFQIFDKVLCNPPLYAHLGIDFLKKDQRFHPIGAIAKHYPELIFLIHSLSHLKKCGVFIVRNQVLQKNASEAKVRSRLCKQRMIRSIIELPKNIFPHQNNDFSIVVIMPNSEEILHINASDEFFYEREGKYNRLKNIEVILEIFFQQKEGKYSKITKTAMIENGDLRASHFISKKEPHQGNRLRDIGFEVMRGQRVYGGKSDEEICFFDVGIADFAPLGFCSVFENKKYRGDPKKIKKYQLKPYDILLSLRGATPKVTILGEIYQICVANVGVVILRHKNKQRALALYCYLFLFEGAQRLREIYEKSSDGVLDLQSLLDFTLPKDYESIAEKNLPKILDFAEQFQDLEQRIHALRQQKISTQEAE
ncbi:N-6 DNA methylase [Helicobacter mustelae]|uniref:site-specific DNA-methyltransferase (adenine-specific) n=1 Tax=Helicobacter mustelae (strain ATCC 43772 / CCUG 25715 / CIP 103759 / LMG 18044 / NCTC 12198 / R85-136P) TaxID=679897 RepID=D3UGT6_HELM1|nr:N-6 DNA methylase [Helicobacter mustelae]CBG39707.1 putative type I restriction-modification system M protein [Helicobacter mustelae 12198]SQH71213.1 type I restriction-modification system M protein [Helicobacter mustelae]